MLKVKWESLPHKSGEPLLSEGCHALKPVLGRDVLKQQNMSYQGSRARGQQRLVKLVQPVTRSESTSFYCLWTLALGHGEVLMGLSGSLVLWGEQATASVDLWPVSISFCLHTAYVPPENSVSFSSMIGGFAIRNLVLNPDM